MTDLLSIAFENLKVSILNYEEARHLKGNVSGEAGAALHAYYRAERAFNHQLGLEIRETGEVPSVAQEALRFQRNHGFHARGLVKILSVHADKWTVLDCS